MLSMMPLLSIYWPYLLTSVLVYVAYVLIFGHNRGTPPRETEIPKKIGRLSKEIKKGNYSSKDDVEDDGEEELQPLTFPEDTPHIPYVFNEISEVRWFLSFVFYMTISLS